MSQRKVFVSKAGIELAAMLSIDGNELFLETKEGDAEISFFLDKKDTTDLIRELQKINKQIPE